MRKQTTKKLLTILTAVTLLLLSFTVFVAAQEGEYVPTTQAVEAEKTVIEIGKEYEFSDSVYAIFTAEKSGLYRLSYSDCYLSFYLEESDIELDEKYAYFDKDGIFYTGYIAEIELEAKKTYTIIARNWDFDNESSIILALEFICGHDNKEEKPAIEPSCGLGYAAGVYCPDCKKWLSGHESSFKSHTDENGDRICDICGNESIDASGVIGDDKNAEYKLYSDGELVISGTGSIGYFNVNTGDENFVELSNNVKTVTIEEGITEIEYHAFSNLSNVETINLPESLEKIGECVFSSMKLKRLYIPSGVKELDIIHSFNSESFEEFEVSPENKTFSSQNGVLFSKDMKILYAYPGAKKGKTYTVPDGVERIYDYAFYYCSELEKPVFPESLIFIGEYAFSDIILENAETENHIKYIGTVAIGTEIEDESGSVLLNVREGTKIIASRAFSEVDFSGIVLPEGLVSIGSNAFEGSYADMTGFVIPKSVKYIDDEAFDGCIMDSLIVPESVEYFGGCCFKVIEVIAFLNPNCKIGALLCNWNNNYYYNNSGVKLIVGYDGSTAEQAAMDNNSMFASLSEGHEHLYFCTEYHHSTCTENGLAVYSCPCGTVEPKEEIIYAEHWWDLKGVDADGTEHYVCSKCGATADEVGCECICHKDGIYKFFYKIVRIFWKLFKINDECECGYYSHY